jgi:hypothetical protein
MMGTVSEPPGERAFLDHVLRNPWVGEIAARASRLDLPDWYLAAGCLYQTAWNVLDGRDPQRGIADYDLIYWDGSDLSWEAEDVVIRRCAAAFADLDLPDGVAVEVRNQARVHLWYEDHFGVPCPPLRSSAEAIDRYAAFACQVGLRLTIGERERDGEGDGEGDDNADAGYEVYAPAGFDDLFGFVLRPNPLVAPRNVYETKAARWVALWPRLTVLPWPDDGAPAGLAARD